MNPTISAEYVSGFGKSVRSTISGRNPQRQPNALAFRLLLGQNLGDHFGYGLNIGLEQDVSPDSGREFELDQAISYGAMKGKLEVGSEMRYIHDTARARSDEADELLIGPTVGWKPTRQLRVSFAPLFGCTDESARLAGFFLVSYEFGGAEAIVTPISGNH